MIYPAVGTTMSVEGRPCCFANSANRSTFLLRAPHRAPAGWQIKYPSLHLYTPETRFFRITAHNMSLSRQRNRETGIGLRYKYLCPLRIRRSLCFQRIPPKIRKHSFFILRIIGLWKRKQKNCQNTYKSQKYESNYIFLDVHLCGLP